MHRRRLAAVALLFAILITAACGNKQPGTAASAGEPTITLGYSAWPGWFPLAVAKEKGIFAKAGIKVDLKYFTDYSASIEALSSGKLDGVTETLNDTIASVAGGAQEVIVAVNDNSTGNDKIICDQSVKTMGDLKGKTVAAEAGVVDHFLLDQGLKKAGLTEKDIDFRGVATDAAAASFADGQFDCVGVFAPFWLTALKRPGSHELFTSKDFPGTIPDHIVVTKKLVDEHPQQVQKLVDAWYMTLDYMKAHPDESLQVMAKAAETSVDEYKQLAEGTTIFTAQQAADAFKDGNDTESLVYTAKLINPFLVQSGLTEKEAPLDGLFDSRFTDDWIRRGGK